MSINTSPTQFVAGRLCLDFLNTANWSEASQVIEEKLGSDNDVAAWCRAAGLQTPVDQNERVSDIRLFRNSLRAIFLTALSGAAPKKSDLARLNEALASVPHQALRPSAKNQYGITSTLGLASAVAVSATALLSQNSEISRVKICPGDGCAWMFLDESKNRRRTWCSMETCGNRAKAKRHYQRNRQTAT